MRSPTAADRGPTTPPPARSRPRRRSTKTATARFFFGPPFRFFLLALLSASSRMDAPSSLPPLSRHEEEDATRSSTRVRRGTSRAIVVPSVAAAAYAPPPLPSLSVVAGRRRSTPTSSSSHRGGSSVGVRIGPSWRSAASPARVGDEGRPRGEGGGRRRRRSSGAFGATTTRLLLAASDENGEAKTSSRAEVNGVAGIGERGDDGGADEASKPGGDRTIDLKRISEQFASFREMAYPYYEESSSGRWLFAGMIGLTLLNSGVSVAFSYVGKDFWNALSSRDAAEFYPMLAKYAAALVVGAPVTVLYRYQRERLAVNWREWMTDRTLQLYSSNRVYYALERGSDIDNPDQRISEDVRSFTAFSLQLFLTIVTSVIDLVSFSVILYSIQPQLFVAIFAYATFGSVVTALVGKNLVSLNFEKLQKEADFRYSLVRVRDNAESIAFYAGEDIEGKEISDRLRRVAENRRSINVAERNLEFFTTCYRYFIQILPVWVVAPQFFAGTIQLGVVSQSVGAFNHILNDLSVIVNQFEQLSSFSAAIDRLSQFMGAVREADAGRTDGDGLMKLPNATTMDADDADVDVVATSADDARCPASEGAGRGAAATIALRQMAPLGDLNSPLATSGGDGAPRSILSMRNVTLATPDRKRTLVKDLSLTLREGQNLLIVGNSGAGKSSLLRAIAGLWTAGSGSIDRPSDGDVYFLPQRPYCALGSLKDQLLYPSLEDVKPEDYPEGHRLGRAHLLRRSMTDDDLLAVLDAVDLSELPVRAGDGDPIAGLHAVLDWSNTLSLGEQQRLAFGRLLVNRPRLVVLDEATSALDMVSEAKMYSLLRDVGRRELAGGGGGGLSRPGLTYVSVGHRPSLLVHHDVRLRLRGDDHEVSPIPKTTAETSPSNVVENL